MLSNGGTRGLGNSFSAADRKRLPHLQITLDIPFLGRHIFRKFTFLFFYRFLSGVSSAFMRAWGMVFTLTAITFMANALSIIWACETPRHLFDRGITHIHF